MGPTEKTKREKEKEKAWREKGAGRTMMMVYQAGGEREIDEPPPFLCYTGQLALLETLRIWILIFLRLF